MSTDITDVLRNELTIAADGEPSLRMKSTAEQVAALAAATADGPLVEDVDCPTCGGDGELPVTGEGIFDHFIVCPDCNGRDRVRIVVIRESDLPDDIRCHLPGAAARIIGGEHDH